MKNEIIILLPAYNEELNIEKMVRSWESLRKPLQDKYGLALKIIAINDGSKDKTEEICKNLSIQFKNFIFISHSHNKGLGEALKTGMLYIVKQCPDCRFACVMDCDNTQDPNDIIRMLDKIGFGKKKLDYDVVIASRYQKGSNVQGVAKYRLLASEGAKYVYGAILNVRNVRDYTCGYRLYSAEIIRKCKQRFGDDLIEESGFTCMAELLFKMHLIGARFSEVPFELRYDNKKGKSKMNVMKTAIRSIKLAFHLRSLKNKI